MEIKEELKTVKLIGELSDDEILNLKNQHPDLYEIVVEDHVAYFRKPKLKEYAVALKYLSAGEKLNAGDRLNAGVILIKELFVAGSITIINDDDYTVSAAFTVLDLIEIKSSELKKK